MEGGGEGEVWNRWGGDGLMRAESFDSVASSLLKVVEAEEPGLELVG